MSSAKEKRYMGKVAALGCLICKQPAHVHHIREDRIKNNFLTIPLCPDHHLGAFSIHMNKKQFQNIYGSELFLLANTIELLSQ